MIIAERIQSWRYSAVDAAKFGEKYCLQEKRTFFSAAYCCCPEVRWHVRISALLTVRVIGWNFRP